MTLLLDYQSQINAVIAQYKDLATPSVHVRAETKAFQLPPEVIESILSHCDWLDLVRLRQVSQHWSETIKEHPDISDVLLDAYMHRRDGSKYDNEAFHYSGPLELRVIIQPHPKPYDPEERSQYIWTVSQLFHVEKQYNYFFQSIRKGLHSLRVYAPRDPIRMKFCDNNRELGEALEKSYREWKSEGLCQPPAADVHLHCTFRFDNREVSHINLKLYKEQGIVTHDVLSELKVAFGRHHNLYLDGIVTKKLKQAHLEIARLKRQQAEDDAKSGSQLDASESSVSKNLGWVDQAGQGILEKVRAIERCEGCRNKDVEEPLCPRCEFIGLMRERLEAFVSGARCALFDDTIQRLSELKEALVPPFDSEERWVDEGVAELSWAMNRIPAFLEMELVSATMLQLCVDIRPSPTLDDYLSRKCCPEGSVQWQCADCGTLDLQYEQAWECALNAFYFEERQKEGNMEGKMPVDSTTVPARPSMEDLKSFLMTECVRRPELELTLWDLVEPVKTQLENKAEMPPQAPEPEIDWPEADRGEPSGAEDNSDDEFFSCDEGEEPSRGVADERVEQPQVEHVPGVAPGQTEVEANERGERKGQLDGGRALDEEQLDFLEELQLDGTPKECEQVEQIESPEAEHAEQTKVEPRSHSAMQDDLEEQQGDSAVELFKAQQEQNLRANAAPERALITQANLQIDTADANVACRTSSTQGSRLLNWLADVSDQPPPIPRRSPRRVENGAFPARPQPAVRPAGTPSEHTPRDTPTALNQHMGMHSDSFVTNATRAMLGQASPLNLPSSSSMSTIHPGFYTSSRRSPLRNDYTLVGNISPRPPPILNQGMGIGMDSFVTAASRAILAQPPPSQRPHNNSPRGSPGEGDEGEGITSADEEQEEGMLRR
ncbi:hypothetical protein BKA63DRAFT_246402 [Paraphoma chrysanthemicola]|nr:hypothetical protein BKA63DRAFT_246402 [Paraphoma chrysanthemicola]